MEQDLAKHILELVGKDILCHCEPHEPCHGGYLLEVAQRSETQTMAAFVDDGLPVRISTAFPPKPPVSFLPAVIPGWGGGGPPRVARHIGGDKPFSDGGGLCSPGRWSPSRRRLPGVLSGLRLAMTGHFERAVAKASG